MKVKLFATNAVQVLAIIVLVLLILSLFKNPLSSSTNFYPAQISTNLYKIPVSKGGTNLKY